MMTPEDTTNKETDIEKDSLVPEEQESQKAEENSKDEPKWFALKASRKENKALEDLAKENIESFCPMVKTDVVQRGKKVIVERPLVPNTLFAFAPYRVINSFKYQYSYITFCYRKEGNNYKILQIPKREMDLFIESSQKMNDDITYFQPGEVELKKGDRVRIIGGVFDGYEGTLLKAKGRAKRMFLINFELLGSLGTHIEPEFIQILK